MKTWKEFISERFDFDPGDKSKQPSSPTKAIAIKQAQSVLGKDTKNNVDFKVSKKKDPRGGSSTFEWIWTIIK